MRDIVDALVHRLGIRADGGELAQYRHELMPSRRGYPSQHQTEGLAAAANSGGHQFLAPIRQLKTRGSVRRLTGTIKHIGLHETVTQAVHGRHAQSDRLSQLAKRHHMATRDDHKEAEPSRVDPMRHRRIRTGRHRYQNPAR